MIRSALSCGKLLLGLCVLQGCCGNGTGAQEAIPPGYYRGTATIPFPDANSGPDTVPLIADVAANGDVEAHGRSANRQIDLYRVGSAATMILDGSVVFSGSLVTVAREGGFTFEFRDGATVWAHGSVDGAQLPQLGSQVIVPYQGNYRGDFVIVSEGRARGYGIVSATFDDMGNWVASASGGGEWFGSGLLAGRFEPDGTVSNALISVQGQIIPQSIPPGYSFDGSTLIVRYDNIRLESGSIWLTLTPTGD